MGVPGSGGAPEGGGSSWSGLVAGGGSWVAWEAENRGCWWLDGVAMRWARRGSRWLEPGQSRARGLRTGVGSRAAGRWWPEVARGGCGCGSPRARGLRAYVCVDLKILHVKQILHVKDILHFKASLYIYIYIKLRINKITPFLSFSLNELAKFLAHLLPPNHSRFSSLFTFGLQKIQV